MKISVVTVAFNAEATIRATLQSVAAQDWADVEHIVIDGASTDATLARVHEAPGDRLRVISEPDRGLYDAMNKGFREARGDLIGFLNADDFYCRTDALTLVATAAGAGAGEAVCGGVVVVDRGGPLRVLRRYPAVGFRPWMVRLGHMPPHPGFFVRREAALAVGPFDLRYEVGADFDWMVRFFLASRLRARLVPETLTAMGAGGVTQRLSGILSSRREASASLAAHGCGWSAGLANAKYALKLGGFLVVDRSLPVPARVRWPTDALPC